MFLISWKTWKQLNSFNCHVLALKNARNTLNLLGFHEKINDSTFQTHEWTHTKSLFGRKSNESFCRSVFHLFSPSGHSGHLAKRIERARNAKMARKLVWRRILMELWEEMMTLSVFLKGNYVQVERSQKISRKSAFSNFLYRFRLGSDLCGFPTDFQLFLGLKCVWNYKLCWF